MKTLPLSFAVLLSVAAFFNGCAPNEAVDPASSANPNRTARIETEQEAAAATAGRPFMSRGLIAYYSFNGTANDGSGNGNHALPQNAFSYVNRSSRGQAIRLVGDGFIGAAGGHVILPSILQNTMTAFSVAMWVKEESLTSSDGEGYLFFGTDDSNGWLGIMHRNAGLPDDYLEFAVNGSGITIQVPYNPAYQNTFTHFAMTYSNGLLKAFINGEPVGQRQVGPVALGSSNAGMGIHWWYANSTRFVGSLDEVRIYGRVLRDNEVKTLYILERQSN